MQPCGALWCVSASALTAHAWRGYATGRHRLADADEDVTEIKAEPLLQYVLSDDVPRGPSGLPMTSNPLLLALLISTCAEAAPPPSVP